MFNSTAGAVVSRVFKQPCVAGGVRLFRTTVILALPVPEEPVARPATGLFADRLQLVAPDTEADTVVVPPDATVDGTRQAR